jgi:predicted amidohydrolase
LSELAQNRAFTVALGEYDTGWHNPSVSLQRARELAKEAREAGARLLVLPEMCTSGFTMAASEFADADDGPSVRALSKIAAEFEIWIVAGMPMRRDTAFVNSAVAIAPDGEVKAIYDKQRLFAYATEHKIYSPGGGPCIVEIDGVSVALLICYDLRFPELFRAVGPASDAFIVIANWPTQRQRHWEVLTQARAIENQCFMIAVNRTGEADGLKYAGGSVVFDPWGERVDRPTEQAPLRVAEVSHAAVAKTRRAFPIQPAENA